MTPAEVPGLLEAIRARVATAAPSCAMAMGETHERYLTGVTLTSSGAHGPATIGHYPDAAPPGAPPATMTGALRRSITLTRGATGGEVAATIVAPHVIYDCALEFGGTHSGAQWLWLNRTLTAGEVKQMGWVKLATKRAARPYMRPSRDAVIADGSLVGAAEAAFMRWVWG